MYHFIIAKGHAARFQNITRRFSSTYDAVEEQLKNSTIGWYCVTTIMVVFHATQLCHCVGLVTLDEMKAKQEDLVREREKQLAASAIEAEK